MTVIEEIARPYHHHRRHRSSRSIARSAARFATAAVASLANKQLDTELFINNDNTYPNKNPMKDTDKIEENNTLMDTIATIHPLTTDWTDSESDNDVMESKSSLESENKSLSDNESVLETFSDDRMDADTTNNNNKIASGNNNNINTKTTNDAFSVSSLGLKSSDRIPLQLIFDMDETMSHYLPNTGTSMITVNLPDVPFYPAIGLPTPIQPSPSSSSSSSSPWLSPSSSSLHHSGTNATFIYSSYPSLSNDFSQITILLEDASLTPCEKRSLPSMNGIVLIRPHFRSFLDRLFNDNRFDSTIRIWTAAPQSYADQVLNTMGWSSSIKRIYQHNCAKFYLQRPLLAHRVRPNNNNPSSLGERKGSSFEVSDLTVGDIIYLKPISALFHLDGGDKWSASNTILVDNAAYTGLQYGQKQILAPDFIALPLDDSSLIDYWCQILQHRYPSECSIVLKSLGINRLEDGIREGKILIKRIIDDKWMEGEEGYNKIIKSIESSLKQSNEPADLGYFGSISFGQPIV